MEHTRILVVGSANVDLVAQVPRHPKPGESLMGSAFHTVCGGKGANQAVAAARLGARTFFKGCVGDDAFGRLQRQGLADAGVEISHLQTSKAEPTGTAIILVAETGQNSIVVVPAANLDLTPEDVERLAPLFADLDAVLLQLEIRLDTVEATLELAQDHGVCSILDAGPAQAVPEAILALADIVSPNETEVEAITGVAVHDETDAPKAAEALHARGAREVVIKLGGHGAYYSGPGERFHVPAFSVTPVDTTAAGDAFTAALALRWKKTSRREAVRFANAVGALATTGAGAQPSMPSRERVEAFLEDHEE